MESHITWLLPWLMGPNPVPNALGGIAICGIQIILSSSHQSSLTAVISDNWTKCEKNMTTFHCQAQTENRWGDDGSNIRECTPKRCVGWLYLAMIWIFFQVIPSHFILAVSKQWMIKSEKFQFFLPAVIVGYRWPRYFLCKRCPFCNVKRFILP